MFDNGYCLLTGLHHTGDAPVLLNEFDLFFLDGRSTTFQSRPLNLKSKELSMDASNKIREPRLLEGPPMYLTPVSANFFLEPLANTAL